MLFQRLKRRRQIVGRIALPLKRKLRIADECIDQRLENSFTIGTVGHDEDACAIVEAEREMTPSFIMSFFEKGATIRRGVKTPADPVRKMNGIVDGRRFRGQSRELMKSMNSNLDVEH